MKEKKEIYRNSAPTPSVLLLTLSQILDHVRVNIQHPPETIFSYIIKKLVVLLEAKAGNIRLYDSNSKKLMLKGSYGVSEKYRKAKAALGLKNSVAGLVFSSRKLYIAEDLRRNKIYRLPEYAIKEEILSLICLPLVSDNKKLGVMSIYFPSVKKFSEQEIKFFDVLVDFLAGFLENRMLEYELRKSYLNLAKILIVILEEKDRHTKGHSERVKEYALKIANKLNLDKKELHILSEFSELHDIGKIIIDSNILNKPDKLSEEEWQAVRQHPLTGERIIQPVSELTLSLPLIKHHHERVDGRGYPEGLKGQEIPMLVKIITVVDAFDAIVSTRAYRKALNLVQAKKELQKNAGTQFDREVVRVMLELIEAGEIKLE